MRLWLAVVAATVSASEASACPTCAGPRLGDSSTGELSVRAALRTSVGSDRVGELARWELRNELAAGLSYGLAAFDVAAPLLWRDAGGSRFTGVGDVTARGSLELWRSEAPAASDTLRLASAIGIPTSSAARVWTEALGTQAVTPSVAVGYRHSDQGWAISAIAFAAWPIALPGSSFAMGPSAGAGAALEYEALRWLSWRLALDLKHQWAVRDAAGAQPDSQYLALALGGEARAQPLSWLGVTAAVAAPLFSISPGQYRHGFVYRLALDVAL